MATEQPDPLPVGKCEQCHKTFDGTRFSLWYDFSKKRRSCEHLVCGPCRGSMSSWQKPLCPNSACQKRFYSIYESLCPAKASTEDFFLFINYNWTGRITKEELAAWYMANFDIESDDAMAIINGQWHLWDVPKNRSFLQLGWFRPQDQGDLDKEEFKEVQPFLAESLSRSLAAAAAAPAAAPAAAAHATASQPPAEVGGDVPPGGSSTSGPSESVELDGKGLKRPRSKDADDFADGMLRRVAQKTLSNSKELQEQLRNNSDRGRSWFDFFDRDKSGELEKNELTTALLQTFLGSHKITREQITSIVESIWDAIDTDGSGSIHFGEFQTIREAVIAQLNHERVTEAVAGIVQSDQVRVDVD